MKRFTAPEARARWQSRRIRQWGQGRLPASSAPSCWAGMITRNERRDDALRYPVHDHGEGEHRSDAKAKAAGIEGLPMSSNNSMKLSANRNTKKSGGMIASSRRSEFQ